MGRSISNVMPADVDKVVFVDVRALEQHIVNDVLINPFSLFGGAEGDSLKSQTKPSIIEALEVPRSFSFYQRNNNSAWHLTPITITDESKVTAYLESRGYAVNDKANSTIYRKGQQQVQIANGQMFWSFGASQDLKAPSTFLKDGDTLYQALADSDSEVVYVDKYGNQVALACESGRMVIDGYYKSDLLKETNAINASESLGTLSTSFNMEQLWKSLDADKVEAFRSFTKLNTDSLSQYLDGGFTARLHGYLVTSDTVKTYEYDDDFNKVEKVSIKKSSRPNYTVSLQTKGDALSYLRSKNAVVESEGKQVLAIMPLVPTMADQQGENLHFYTDNTSNDSKLDSKVKLQANLDVARINELMGDDLPAVLSSIIGIDLRIGVDNKVKGSVEMRSQRNAFAQLVK